MPDSPLRVLHLEDDPADAELVWLELQKAGFEPVGTVVFDEPGFTAALAADPDIVLCDWNLPAFDAERALAITAERCPDVPVVIVSGSIGEEAAVRAIRLGATDYLLKDRLGRLGQAVKQALAQRNLREAERRSRERYRALADSIPHIVWTTDPAGQLDYLNQWSLDYSGLTLADLAGEGWVRMVHPDDAVRVRDTWGAIVRTGEPRDYEVRFRRADGNYRWHICRQVAFRDPAGVVTHWIGTCTDVHDHKSAAAALARDAQILAGVRDAVVVTDLDGVVTFWNDGATALFGWTAPEMIGRPYADRFPQAAREEVARQIRERAAGSEWRGEYEDLRKDGTRVWIDARVRRFDRPDGTPAGILGVSHDITERRRLEEQFRQAQKMEAIGRLAGGVAHDFNNLLTVINGYADLLLSETASDAPDRPPLLAIRDAGERASGLTSQLLAFSRKSIIAPRVMDLNERVAHAEKLLRRLIGEDITLATVLAPTPCRIEVDPNQLDQVIMNLAVNARDAMPGGGRLVFETARSRLTALPATESGDFVPGRYVELFVRDTGCGMPDDVKARLFEPFFTTKGPGKGTGLGLAVVHGVVKQAGGYVLVESQVGVGSTFRILFPEVGPPSHQTVPGENSSGGRGTETILLVEDDDAVRTLCRKALELQGFRVLAARGGSEAMRTIAGGDGRIDLLVTDVVMPGMNGRELANTARTKIPGVRVLYVSGYTDDAVVRHGVREATDAFLQKPFTPYVLSRKVRAVLDGMG